MRRERSTKPKRSSRLSRGLALLAPMILAACGASGASARPAPAVASAGPQPDVLSTARTMHACDGEGADSVACARLGRFAAAHAPAPLARGRSYIGGSLCAGDTTDEILDVVIFADGRPAPSDWHVYPVDESVAVRVEQLRARLTGTAVAPPSEDPNALIPDALIWLAADPAWFSEDATELSIDEAHDVVVGTREIWGPVVVRESGDHLLFVSTMPTGTCVGELEPYRDVDADTRPVVYCMSGMRDGTPSTAHYTICSDQHTYGISCEARHCSCMRDEVLVQTVDIEESQTMPRAMRYDCGFDTPG